MELRQECGQIMNEEIQKAIEGILAAGSTVSAETLRSILYALTQRAYVEGEKHKIDSLITTKELAEMLGVDRTRANALARSRHKQYGIGYQIPGTNQWLFQPEDMKLLLPTRPGRPRGAYGQHYKSRNKK